MRALKDLFVRRRAFLQAGVGLLTGSLAGVAVAQSPSAASRSGPFVPVVSPDIRKLPYEMDGAVKVFKLTAEVVKQEFIPGKVFDLWGYSGSAPGPTIEVFEGDRVRILFENRLPEPTTVHWHGLEVPIEMDGVPMISQPEVEPGGKFTYEFMLHQHGTFFYHSHGPMQEMMGMLGMFVIHPKTPYAPRVDKDYAIVLQEYGVLPNNTIPNSLSMEFNWLTFNGKAGPATTPLIVRLDERVRVRFVNIGMDHHPIHLHGMQFEVTGTEGGRIPQPLWYPQNTVLVGVAQARVIEFNAKFPGDWIMHCHLPHHMMNAMVSMVGPMAHVGHGVKTGAGMEEGMGVMRGNALADENGPAFGRGMGMAATERAVSGVVGQARQNGHGAHGAHGGQGKKRVPGFPQDMMMVMDDAVAKPETYGMAKGWSGAIQGMHTVVRVLPPDKYDDIVRRIREAAAAPPKPKTKPTAPAQGHKH